MATPTDGPLRRLPPPPAALAPVLAVLDGLSIARRIGALVACLLIPGLVTTYSFAASLGVEIEVAATERYGVGIVATTLHVIVDVVDGRTVDPIELKTQIIAHPELVSESVGDAVLRAVDQHNPNSPQSRVRTAEALRLFVTEVSRTSNLLGDAESSRFSLLRALVERLPAALVATAEAAAPVPVGHSLVGSRSVQAGVLSAASTGIRHDLQASVDQSTDPGFGNDVAPLMTASRTLSQLAYAITEDFADAESIEQGPALAAVDAAIGPSADTLQDLLDVHVRTLEHSRDLALVVAILGFAAATWIGVAVIWRTRTDVVQLVGGVTALAAGDRREHEMPAGGDEFGDIGRALAGARTRLSTADEEIRRQSEERLRLLRLGEARQRVLEHLLGVQRLISARTPLPEIFDQIVASAASILGDVVVGLVVCETDDGRSPSLVATSVPVGPADKARIIDSSATSLRTGRGTTRPDLLAAPVIVRDAPAGALLALLQSPADPADDTDRAALLQAFAQQVGLAVTDARTAAEVFEARHDLLTGLPNRTLFLSLLTKMLETDDDEALTLLFIDLDRFKSVNDSLGHQAGDELLAAVSSRLRECLHENHIASRLGGDEFAVAIRGPVASEGRAIAQRIIAVLREPFVIGGTTAAIDASIGIAYVIGGDESHDAASLLSDADIAMYRAKKSGGGHAVVFESHMREESRQRLTMVADLRAALTARRLHLEYQPVVDLATGLVAGVEALARWHHPVRGNIAPTTFIAVAEEIGVIEDLGRWVLRDSLRQLRSWRSMHPLLRLNINVSGHQLAADNFPAVIASELHAAGVRPESITLELTESVVMNDPENAPRQLAKLKELGVRIAVDDFGTGYSSLAYLRRLPVDDVKIDREFVKGLGSDERDYAVVATVLELTRSLQLRAVAEGVETPGQLAALRRLGCPYGQGYLLGRPMLPAQLAAFCGAPSAVLAPPALDA